MKLELIQGGVSEEETTTKEEARMSVSGPAFVLLTFPALIALRHLPPGEFFRRLVRLRRRFPPGEHPVIDFGLLRLPRER